jgi:hypothetical protein
MCFYSLVFSHLQSFSQHIIRKKILMTIEFHNSLTVEGSAVQFNTFGFQLSAPGKHARVVWLLRKLSIQGQGGVMAVILRRAAITRHRVSPAVLNHSIVVACGRTGIHEHPSPHPDCYAWGRGTDHYSPEVRWD